MSEEKLTSNKLDFEQKRQILNNSEDNRESYKTVSEDFALDHVAGDTLINSNMVRENANLQDGADEKMLGSDDKETLALKDVEVKFIPAADSNGDAKIEIESAEKSFTGMTKEELMKYANDPFWVKLRWFLFVLFWAAWIGMLIGAIMIILNAPKCAAPIPLPWYKEGPLVSIGNDVNDTELDKFAEHEVQGVIYELPADETYLVDTPAVQDRIKKMVEKYKTKNIHFVIDLTPNYVTKDDALLKQALNNDVDSLAAFVTSDKDISTWKKIVPGEGSAWEMNGNKYFLKQFGDHYDLRLDNSLAKDKFKDVLSKLADIGVKGFRLANAKNFIIKASDLTDEQSQPNPQGNLGEYKFYHHAQSTYLEGLGQLLHDFNKHVKNITNDEGFLTVKDDLSLHIDKYTAGGSFFGFELPRFGFINSLLREPDAAKSKKLKEGFDTVSNHLSSLSNNWMQIEYSSKAYNKFEESAFKLFIGLLNGVQISTFNDLVYIKNNSDVYTKLQKEHKTPVFQHGNFEYYLSNDEKAFAYSRMKSGNPGYFVVLNPSNETIYASFNETSVLGSDLTFLLTSSNFVDLSKNKVNIQNITMPRQSTAIFTFVPK